MTEYGYVFAGVAVLLIVAATLIVLWPRMDPYVPRQQEERLAALDPVAEFTSERVVGRAVVPIEPVVISLARLRDTGGYVGQIHRDCLTARRDGGEICPECRETLVGA